MFFFSSVCTLLLSSQIGRRGNCTYCGVLRRGALERGTRELGAFDNGESGTQEDSRSGKECCSKRGKNDKEEEETQAVQENQIVEGVIEGEYSNSGDQQQSGQERVAVLATGHNADDMAETVLLNVLRGDVARLARGLHSRTAGQGRHHHKCMSADGGGAVLLLYICMDSNNVGVYSLKMT